MIYISDIDNNYNFNSASNYISKYINNYNEADFALRLPMPKLGIPKIGMPKIPRIPKYNDSVGSALGKLKTQTIQNKSLPSTRNILKTLAPAVGRDLVTNPIKTVKALRPRLHSGRVLARKYAGVRIPSARQMGRRFRTGLGNVAREQAVNGSAYLGGMYGGFPGAVGAAMATRKAITNGNLLYKSMKQSGGNIKQGFKNYLGARKGRNQFEITNNTLKDVYGNALTNLTPLAKLPTIAGNEIASKLTPSAFTPKALRTGFNNLTNKAKQIASYNPYKQVNNFRNKVNRRLNSI